MGRVAEELDAGRRPRNNPAAHAKYIRSSYDHRERLVRRVADSKHYGAPLDVRHNPLHDYKHNPVRMRYDVLRSLGCDYKSFPHDLPDTWAVQQEYPQIQQVPLELAMVFAAACKVPLQVRIHGADGQEMASDVEGSLGLRRGGNRRYSDLFQRSDISKMVSQDRVLHSQISIDLSSQTLVS